MKRKIYIRASDSLTMILPIYIPLVFSLCLIFVWVIFLKASFAATENRTHRNLIAGGLTIWLFLQAYISLTGFYSSKPLSLPPRFLLILAPPLILIISLFVLKKGRQFIDRMPAGHLTLIHSIRLPVELVLYWLYLQAVVSELMTFEGRNFDILIGITAPMIWYFGIKKQMLPERLMLFWNVLGLIFLLNIVIHGFLSAPSPFQKLAFDQPNIAVLHFPYSLLPGFIVPGVLFAHLVIIRRFLFHKS